MDYKIETVNNKYFLVILSFLFTLFRILCMRKHSIYFFSLLRYTVSDII